MIIKRNDNKGILPDNMNKDEKTFMDHVQDLAVDDNFEYTEAQQIGDVYLMFLTGTGTTSLSLEWGLILLSRQKDIQNRVRNELMTVLKENRKEVVYDIQLLLQLPLFRACIYEILRISCVARMAPDHAVTEHDLWITTDDGIKYRVPEGSSVIYNIECMHYDDIGSEKWKNKEYGLNMEQICLENWIDEETGKFQPHPSFMSFGSGKRDCVGKQLALKEMRVMLGYLLLNYKFGVDREYEEMDRIPCSGGVRGSVCKPTVEIPINIKPIGIV